MLNDKLKSKEYYINKLTLFLRNSYGIKEQVELYWQLLSDMNSVVADIFNAMTLSEVDKDNIFDVVAEIVGCKRHLDIEYISNGLLYSKTLSLTNEELYRFIKTKILQNNYFGGQEQLVANYIDLGLNVWAVDSTSGPGFVSHILNDDEWLTDNDKDMFLSGHYTIRSVGIVYEFSIGQLDMLGIWDSPSTKWDINQWGD